MTVSSYQKHKQKCLTMAEILTKISLFFDELDLDDDFFPENKFLIHFPGLLPFPITSAIVSLQNTELRHQKNTVKKLKKTKANTKIKKSKNKYEK